MLLPLLSLHPFTWLGAISDKTLRCRFVPLLYSLLDSKEDEAVQAGALEVLTEIATKRMDAEAKLRLLQQLGLVSRAASWQQRLPGSPDSEVPLKAARLLAALCTGRHTRASI